MTRLSDGHDLFTRGGTPAHRRRLRPILLLLLFTSCALMLLSRLDHTMLSGVRWQIASWLTPLLQTAMLPVKPMREVGRSISTQVTGPDELQRLKSENQRLASWEWRAKQLEAKVADLEALARTVQDHKIAFITSRVIADSSGAFVHNITIDAGSDNKVKSGYPVVNADGLLGRVVDIGPHAARVLLATDLNSRIPVVVGPNAVRAILAGDNSAEPRLIYIPNGAKITPGDDVSTSGTGGLFPIGLRLGTVADGVSQNPRVALRANLDRLDYVSVLFFDDPSANLSDNLLGQKPSDAGAAAETGERKAP